MALDSRSRKGLRAAVTEHVKGSSIRNCCSMGEMSDHTLADDARRRFDQLASAMLLELINAARVTKSIDR